MAWYPRKFSPARHKDRTSELLEEVPPEDSVKVHQMKRMVHFDLDRTNSKFYRP